MINKKIGIGQDENELLNIISLSEVLIHQDVLFVERAKSFFRAYKLLFGNYKEVVINNSLSKPPSKRIMQDLDNKDVAFVNYHFSIELLLKGLIFSKENPLQKKHKTHNLVRLWKDAEKYYPDLNKIENKIKCEHILQVLSTAIDIRYFKANIVLRAGKSGVCQYNRGLIEILDGMFNFILDIWNRR